MVSFSTLRRLQLGGLQDNLALLAGAAGVMATHPVVGPSHWPTAATLGAAAAAGSGIWLGRRLNAVIGLDALEGTGTLRINSSRPPPPTPDGIVIGYIVDTGEPLVIPMRQWMRHALIVGQSGVGKTVLGEWLMFQQIARGGGILWIDGKLDPANLIMLRAMCAWAGRLDDLLVISPGEPDASNTYNPILYGDPDEVSARCLSLIPSTANNPGADYYRQEANQGVATLVNAIQACGLAYNFADVTVLLSNAEALEWLEQRVPYGTDAQAQLSLFLHKFKIPQKNGSFAIDVKKLKDQLGGIGGRMFTFGTGKFGQVTNTYSPEVRIKEDLLANKIIYVALPTMGKAEAASNFGKMVIGDFRTAIAQIQALPEALRPNPPILSFFDECGSYVTDAWSRIFEQSRSAQLMMLPAFQTPANLEAISKELRDMVTDNTLTKCYFKPGGAATAEWMADMIGEEERRRLSISGSQGTGAARKAHLSPQPGGWSDSGSIGFSESLEVAHKISPSELMQLGQGECIVQYDGSNLYHVRIPRVTFSPEIMQIAKEAGINHQRKRHVKGLDLARNIERWVGRRQNGGILGAD